MGVPPALRVAINSLYQKLIFVIRDSRNIPVKSCQTGELRDGCLFSPFSLIYSKIIIIAPVHAQTSMVHNVVSSLVMLIANMLAEFQQMCAI